MYDKETGFYYLLSRYYDPEVGSFLNAKLLVSTGRGLSGFNMFAYCNDNPVIYCDTTGNRCEPFAGVAGCFDTSTYTPPTYSTPVFAIKRGTYKIPFNAKIFFGG